MPEVDLGYHEQYSKYLKFGTEYVAFEDHPIPPEYQKYHDALLEYAELMNCIPDRPLNEMQVTTSFD